MELLEASETPGVGGAGKATTQTFTVILGIQMNPLFKQFAFKFRPIGSL
jgi:hypothetical protein